MAFDQRRYHQDVIVPLRDHSGALPADLVRQYAIELSMSQDDLTNHLRQLRRIWNQRAGGVDRTADVYARLLSRDEQLRAQHGDQMAQLRWWRGQAQQREQDAQGEVRRFADDLARAYGPVGRLTRAQLDAIAAQWPSLDQRRIDEALRLAGLELALAVELPTTSGMSRPAYRALGRALDQVGVPTIVQLIHPQLNGSPFRLLTDDAGVRLDRAAVRQRLDEAERLADSSMTRSRKDALALVQTALDQGADLRRLALFQIVDRLRGGRSRQLPDGLLVRMAVDAGLDVAEAQTIVAALPSTVQEQGPTPGQKIRDLLQDGQLRTAERAFAVLPKNDADWSDLRDKLVDAANQIESMRREADVAVRQHREEDAERLLRAASRIAGDDDDLSRQLDQLAPLPPRDLVARAQDTAVRLTWARPRTGASEVRYRVVRADRPPRAPGDGEVIGELLDVEFVDSGAAPARDVHYAVFASTGGDWSRPVTAAVRLLPPVTAVQIRTQAGEVICGWRAHPAVDVVRARRTVGRPPASERDGVAVDAGMQGLHDPNAPDGAELYYGIVAVYRDERGDQVAAPMVVARATVRDSAPTFVERIRVQVTAVDTSTAIANVTWTTPAAGTVSVRRSDAQPPWPSGTTISYEEFERYGEPLVGDRLAHGAETLVEVAVPSGQFVYVPFTVDAPNGRATVGEPVQIGVTEPVRELLARRNGGELSLAWVWPAPVNRAEIVFVPTRGKQVRQVITRGRYAESGCRIPIGPVGGKVSVRAIARSSGGDTYSAPATATVDSVPFGLEYHLERVGGLMSRSRRLTVIVDQRCEDVELVLIAAAGPAMPTQIEQGRVLQHFSNLTLVPDGFFAVQFEVPRDLRKPYWLRCFVLQPPGVRVTEPIAEMKVA